MVIAVTKPSAAIPYISLDCLCRAIFGRSEWPPNDETKKQQNPSSLEHYHFKLKCKERSLLGRKGMRQMFRHFSCTCVSFPIRLQNKHPDQVSQTITPMIESRCIPIPLKLSWCSESHLVPVLVDSSDRLFERQSKGTPLCGGKITKHCSSPDAHWHFAYRNFLLWSLNLHNTHSWKVKIPVPYARSEVCFQ